MLNPDEITKNAPRALRLVQFLGYIAFFVLMAMLAGQAALNFSELGNSWLMLLVALAGYLAADLASGMVHFLADNFGSPETPFLGQAFVLPFRQHHVDPLGITRHGFFAANGNNALVCLPVLPPQGFAALVVLLPFARSGALVLWTALAPLWWLQGLSSEVGGELPLVTALAHLPAMALFAYECWAPRQVPAAAQPA